MAIGLACRSAPAFSLHAALTLGIAQTPSSAWPGTPPWPAHHIIGPPFIALNMEQPKHMPKPKRSELPYPVFWDLLPMPVLQPNSFHCLSFLQSPMQPAPSAVI